jgi:MinD-like ATPase involved in chromosome partitioning or flagellar assembly
MTSIALALDSRVEDRIIGELLAAGHRVHSRVQSAGELITLAEAGGADVSLVSASRARLNDRVISACDANGLRLIVLAAGELERRHAAALGLYEVLDDSASWDEIERLLHADIARAVPGPAPEPGRTIAVWGPAGAPGRTTVAINLAAEIAGCGHRVVLVDADSYGGSIAPALGLLDEAPGVAAACRLAASDSLTALELERIGASYNSARGAFRVLTGIGRPSRWTELSADRVTKTLAAAALWAEYVVVDTGFSLESDEEVSSDLFAPRRNAATLAALRAADRVIAVGLADPIGMSRFLRAHVDLLEIVPETRVSVIVNRVRASAVGLNPFGQVTSTLARFGGITAAAQLPEDRVGVDGAVLTGRTLLDAVPKSALRASLTRFVEDELVPAPAMRRRRARRRGVIPLLGA